MGGRPQASHAKVSVVDGEDYLGSPEAIGLVVLPEGLSYACSAPVMAVQNVWLAACLQQELQCCLQAQRCRQLPIQPSAWESHSHNPGDQAGIGSWTGRPWQGLQCLMCGCGDHWARSRSASPPPAQPAKDMLHQSDFHGIKDGLCLQYYSLCTA